MLPSKSLKKVLEELRAGLEGGNTLYEAMSRFPHVFQPLDLAIIRMGEQSEVLPKSMKDLALFLEWKEDIRSIIKRAAIYPSFVIFVLTAVIGVWVGYVLPQMAIMLKEMGVGPAGAHTDGLQPEQFHTGKLAMDNRRHSVLWDIAVFVPQDGQGKDIVSQIPLKNACYRQPFQ